MLGVSESLLPYIGASGTGLPKNGEIYELVSAAPYDVATENRPIESDAAHSGLKLNTD